MNVHQAQLAALKSARTHRARFNVPATPATYYPLTKSLALVRSVIVTIIMMQLSLKCH